MGRKITKLLTLILLAALLTLTAGAIEPIAEGTCGNNVTWALDHEGTLTISGNGKIADYDIYFDKILSPWYDYADSIVHAVIEPGVTGIGSDTFCNLPYLESVSIPNSVTYIGHQAFRDCIALTAVSIPNPDAVLDSEGWIFCGCEA